MRCDHKGRPDPNGDHEIRDGRITMRDGSYIGARMMFDSKGAQIGSTSSALASIGLTDQALQAHFAGLARAAGKTTDQLFLDLSESAVARAAADMSRPLAAQMAPAEAARLHTTVDIAARHMRQDALKRVVAQSQAAGRLIVDAARGQSALRTYTDADTQANAAAMEAAHALSKAAPNAWRDSESTQAVRDAARASQYL